MNAKSQKATARPVDVKCQTSPSVSCMFRHLVGNQLLRGRAVVLQQKVHREGKELDMGGNVAIITTDRVPCPKVPEFPKSCFELTRAHDFTIEPQLLVAAASLGASLRSPHAYPKGGDELPQC